MTTEPLSPDLAGIIHQASDRLVGAVRTGPVDLIVPSCPDFTLTDLAFHTVAATAFWAQMVDGIEPGQEASVERPGEGDIAAWLDTELGRWTEVLLAADPKAPVAYTLCDDASAHFAQRRIAHELTIHAWDAANAVDTDARIDPATAIDGVDEYLEVFLGGALGDRSGPSQTVHLHATDLGGTDLEGAGEWHITVGDDDLVVTHEHAKGDLAVRGLVAEILLLLWGRVETGSPLLEVFGDEAGLQRFVGRVSL